MSRPVREIEAVFELAVCAVHGADDRGLRIGVCAGFAACDVQKEVQQVAVGLSRKWESIGGV